MILAELFHSDLVDYPSQVIGNKNEAGVSPGSFPKLFGDVVACMFSRCFPPVACWLPGGL